MTLYKVRSNESPAAIARRFRVPMSSLISANPHKPTKRVGNVTTWQGLRHNETVRLPAGAVGTLGDFLGVTPASPNAPHVQISKGSGAAADVALWQTIIGVTADGAFGPGTEAATKKWQSAHGLTPDGIVGVRSWAAALGSSAAAPTAASTPTAPPSGLTASARAAASALGSDPNYCTSVARVGTAVNTAVHNFKAAWNSANPSRPVPIGTGKYETAVASALSETLGGATVPPGCGAGATPPPPMSAPRTTMPVTSAAGAAPAAVQALAAIDPCRQENASIVAAAQRALGFSASASDGKYGADTATAARRVLPNAPAGCSPRPAWWTPPGQSNASSGAAQAATAAQSAANTAQAAAAAAQGAQTAGQATAAAETAAAAATAAATAAQNATPDQKPAADAAAATAAQAAQAANTAAQAAGGGSAMTPPETKKLSTGAIVAGAVGVAALVGLLAVAASGKKGSHRGARRKSAKHKPKHRAKRKKR